MEFDYLAWTVKGDKLPPLATTSPPGTPQAQAGVLGVPGTSVLFGDSTVNDEWRSGLRARIGYWFDPQCTIGFEGSFFGLEQASTEFNAGSAGIPMLARPFLDALANQQSAALSAFPGLVAGSVNINETSRFLGADALYRQTIGSWGGEHFSVLIGYRYLHSSDKLGIASASTVTGGGFIPSGTTLNVSDSFNATSNFHGLDLGIIGEFTQGPWLLEWRGKVALAPTSTKHKSTVRQQLAARRQRCRVACWRFQATSATTRKRASRRARTCPESRLSVRSGLAHHGRLRPDLLDGRATHRQSD